MARRDNDIKAPDGYLLGGLRKVLKDGTVLFQRGYWGPCPKEWVGEKVWVHEEAEFGWPRTTYLDAAPPGVHIFAAQSRQQAVRLDRTDRPDAAPVHRNPHNKAWAEKMRPAPLAQQTEGEE